MHKKDSHNPIITFFIRKNKQVWKNQPMKSAGGQKHKAAGESASLTESPVYFADTFENMTFYDIM